MRPEDFFFVSVGYWGWVGRWVFKNDFPLFSFCLLFDLFCSLYCCCLIEANDLSCFSIFFKTSAMLLGMALLFAA